MKKHRTGWGGADSAGSMEYSFEKKNLIVDPAGWVILVKTLPPLPASLGGELSGRPASPTKSSPTHPLLHRLHMRPPFPPNLTPLGTEPSCAPGPWHHSRSVLTGGGDSWGVRIRETAWGWGWGTPTLPYLERAWPPGPSSLQETQVLGKGV